MKRYFIFKRDKYWYVQYFDEVENRIKRVSTKCTKKADAIRFLTDFRSKVSTSNHFKHISLIQFVSVYQDYV